MTSIFHRAQTRKEHVIPDTLIRLPISSEGSQLIMLPPDVSSFLTTSLSRDMEYQSHIKHSGQLFSPIHLLNLACQTSVISHSPCHKQASKTPIVCHSTKPPELPPLPSTDINTKPQINYSPPTHSFAPSSIGRYEFIEEQRKDKWLNLIVEYITNECQLSTLKDLSKQQKLWIINIAKRCKIIDGLLTYRDEFMIDHDNYRILYLIKFGALTSATKSLP